MITETVKADWGDFSSRLFTTISLPNLLGHVGPGLLAALPIGWTYSGFYQQILCLKSSAEKLFATFFAPREIFIAMQYIRSNMILYVFWHIDSIIWT